MKIPDQDVRLAVKHAVPAKHRAPGDGFCDVAFPRARRSDQDRIFSLSDEFPGQKLEAFIFRNFRVIAPLEILERLLFRKTRECVAPLDQFRVPPIHLVLQEQ